MAAAEIVAFRPAPPPRVTAREAALWGAVGLGALLALGGLALALGALPGTLPARRGLDVLAVGFLVAAAPVAFAVERRRRRQLRMDARLPDFLADLASLHKAGLTLRDALLACAGSDYGALSRPVREAADQARWNLPVLTALDNLNRRVGTPIAERSFTVVTEAARTGGDVPGVLEIAAENARAFVELRELRGRSMGVYTLITYVASLVFVGVALALQGIFLPRMLAAFDGGAAGALSVGGDLPSADAFRALFFAAALVQAVGNGLVGGVMGEGRVSAGLKHACAMVAMALAGFLLLG
ncbi:MAG TPA: type II secretion system F family protein [Candidatus Thermoplasmatota archaeon]|nr:type II secretion system F family protein [Candidatus Thermoplasmatota archaeon]